MVRNFTGFRHAEIVSASGRLQNLCSVTGRPSFEMSRSFAGAASWCFLAHGSVSVGLKMAWGQKLSSSLMLIPFMTVYFLQFRFADADHFRLPG